MPKRCLIVERREYETGGRGQQVQLPLATANRFFGSGNQTLPITVRVYLATGSVIPTFEKNISISKVYANQTRRINGFPELGSLWPGFLFFEETDTVGTYDFWWQLANLQVIAAKYQKWAQGKNSQHGRGRLITIVPAPVPRYIQHIDD